MPEGFFSLGATELSGEAGKASRPALLVLTDVPRCWRARRPLASRYAGVGTSHSIIRRPSVNWLSKDRSSNNLLLFVNNLLLSRASRPFGS